MCENPGRLTLCLMFSPCTITVIIIIIINTTTTITGRVGFTAGNMERERQTDRQNRGEEVQPYKLFHKDLKVFAQWGEMTMRTRTTA